MKVSRRSFLRLCAACAAAPLWAAPLSGCAARPEFVQRTFFNFDTVCTLGGTMGQNVLNEAQEMCEHFEQLFSRTIATSDVARINAAAGEVVEVDSQTAELVRLALGYCERSDGLFDITIGAVSELWDFAEGVVPSDEAIADALPHVGWQRVVVGQNSVRLEDPDARIDLGGIAKGYITDRLMELYAARGVTDAFVNLGGNVAVMGRNSEGRAWNVGVRDPDDASGTQVVATISTEGGSLVTSGLYERSFEKDGKRYWHILDPRTGYPVQTDVVSASVYARASIDGDGFTKPLFMMERDDALAFVESHEGIEALLIATDGTISTTRNAHFVKRS